MKTWLKLFITCSSFLIIACEPNGDIIEDEQVFLTSNKNVQKSDSLTSKVSKNDELAGNLLRNGSIEEWSMHYVGPVDWLVPSNDYVKSNSSVVYDGRLSAKMQSEKKGKTASLGQLIPVVPNHKIRIRFHYYVEQWKSKGARMYCYLRTAAAEKYTLSADELKSYYDDSTYRIIRGGGYGKTYFPADNQNSWQTFDETITIPPTVYFFVFGINSYNGTTIYIDDCYVIDTTQEISSGINAVYV